MKQLIGVTAFLFLTLFALNAQKVAIGLSGGATLTSWNWNLKDAGKLDFGVGLNSRFAIPVQYQLGSQFALRAELGLQRRSTGKTAIFSDESGIPLGKSSQVYQSVEGSLLAVFQPFNRWQNFYLLGGVSADYVTQSWLALDKDLRKTLLKGRRINISEVIKDPSYQRVQKMIDAGVGYSHNLKFGRLFAEIRAQINTNNIITNGLVTAHYRTAMVNAGYLYQF